jgi:hypothetical protein
MRAIILAAGRASAQALAASCAGSEACVCLPIL